MAQLRFIRGVITGRIGEFIGSTWKGHNYLKTYAKPSNPRTVAQTSIRRLFKSVILFGNALFGCGIYGFFPSPAKMTPRNATVKANGFMWETKALAPDAMQMFPANYGNLSAGNVGAIYNGPNNTAKVTVDGPSFISGPLDTAITARVVIYNPDNGAFGGYGSGAITAGTDFSIDVPLASGFDRSNAMVYIVVTAVDHKGKNKVTDTLSCPLA